MVQNEKIKSVKLGDKIRSRSEILFRIGQLGMWIYKFTRKQIVLFVLTVLVCAAVAFLSFAVIEDTTIRYVLLGAAAAVFASFFLLAVASFFVHQIRRFTHENQSKLNSLQAKLPGNQERIERERLESRLVELETTLRKSESFKEESTLAISDIRNDLMALVANDLNRDRENSDAKKELASTISEIRSAISSVEQSKTDSNAAISDIRKAVSEIQRSEGQTTSAISDIQSVISEITQAKEESASAISDIAAAISDIRGDLMSIVVNDISRDAEHLAAKDKIEKLLESDEATTLSISDLRYDILNLSNSIQGMDFIDEPSQLDEVKNLEAKIEELSSKLEGYVDQTAFEKLDENTSKRIDSLKSDLSQTRRKVTIFQKSVLSDEQKKQDKLAEIENGLKEISSSFEERENQNMSSFAIAQEQLEDRVGDKLSNVNATVEALESKIIEGTSKIARDLESATLGFSDKQREELSENISRAQDRIAETLSQRIDGTQETIQSLEKNISEEIKRFEEKLLRTQEGLTEEQKQQFSTKFSELGASLNEAKTQIDAKFEKEKLIVSDVQKIAESAATSVSEAMNATGVLTERLAKEEKLRYHFQKLAEKTAGDLTSARTDLEKMREDLARSEEKISSVEGEVVEVSKGVVSIANRQPRPYQDFKRVLTDSDIQIFKEQWLKPLNLQESTRSLIYISSRVSMLEELMRGRLATSSEDAVLRALVSLSVEKKTLHVLEIGTLFGVGLSVIYDRCANRFDNVHLTAIDPLEGYYGNNKPDIVTNELVTERVLYENLSRAGVPLSNFSLLKGLSTDDEILAQAAQNSYDVLVIDGDHSYSGVKSDFVNYAPLVNRGGYIIVDDYGTEHWPEIAKYVDDELMGRGDITLVGASWRTAVFRVIKKVST